MRRSIGTGEVTVLYGARVLDPSQRLALPEGGVAIRDGRVLAIGTRAHLEAALARLDDLDSAPTWRSLPAEYALTPGFVDLHVHLREPGFEAKETIQTGARAAAWGGYTTICCMPNTQPVLDSAATLALVAERARDAEARVLPIAAISKGEAGKELSEMAELAQAGAVAFSDDGRPVESSRLMRLALTYAGPLGLPVVEHCQDEDLVGGGVMNEGPISTMLGLPGWPAAGEDVMLARDLALVRLTGAKYHAAHLSTAGAVALIRQAKAEGLPVTAEVTPHHLLLTDAWVAGERTGPLADALRELGLPVPPGDRYDTNTKVNPPLRSARDCQALIEGVEDGTIDAIATDHAPHTWVDKACEYGEAAFGISGLETALAGLLALVHTGRLTLPALIAALTIRPARAWNLRAGSLAPGSPADLTIFDPREDWIVDPAGFASLGKNTPLAGVTLRGRVRETWLGGRLVYRAGGDGEGDAAGANTDLSE
jgi:dihydroorotase